MEIAPQSRPSTGPRLGLVRLSTLGSFQGCWEITGNLRDHELKFVVFIGPSDKFFRPLGH